MKNLSTLFLLLFSLHSLAQTGFDTTGGRFLNKIFDSVTVTSNIPYANGLNVTGQTQDLLMDVYQPFGDTLNQRPVIVLAHGGGFVAGSKEDMTFSATQFAKKGFVTVSIQYRLGIVNITSQAVNQLVVRATQDMKNSIRFLRKSAENGNPYKIHPEYIFAGGFSAGAITAVHAAYMDQVSEIPLDQNITSLDSLHNNSQIPGYDWRFKAVLNIAGAIGDTNWMKPGDTPIASFHGTADGTVPFISGGFGIPGIAIVNLFGSQSIFNRCKSIGVKADLRAFVGAGHDYVASFPWAADTTELRISKFLIPFLTQQITQIELAIEKESPFIISFQDDNWLINSSQNEFNCQILDFQGRVIENKKIINTTRLKLEASGFPRIIRLQSKEGNSKISVLPAFVKN
jgi:acetyl esterase/lipase